MIFYSIRFLSRCPGPKVAANDWRYGQ